MRLLLRTSLAGIVAGTMMVAGTTSDAIAQRVDNAQQVEKRIHEPVYRVNQPSNDGSRNASSSPASAASVANANFNQPVAPMPSPVARSGFHAPIASHPSTPAGPLVDGSADRDNHPLDPALILARRGLDRIRSDIRDYDAYLVKRERINGRLSTKETMYVKIRNGHRTREGANVPFSIYMRFVAPDAVQGREVIWVEGRNDNKLIAHDVGWKALFRATLDPDGRMAMAGNRYPIYEAGIENLVVKLIDVAERDRAAGDCKVEFFQGAEINERSCTVIQVTHDEKREPYDFHIARVYIDDELQIPVRYAAYSWPKSDGGRPVLEEEYTYLDINVNVGLDDDDFDPDNPEYDYP